MANINFNSIKHTMLFEDLANGIFFMHPMTIPFDKFNLYMKIDSDHAYSFGKNRYFSIAANESVYVINSDDVTINVKL